MTPEAIHLVLKAIGAPRPRFEGLSRIIDEYLPLICEWRLGPPSPCSSELQSREPRNFSCLALPRLSIANPELI
jgi:hypothetical protein